MTRGLEIAAWAHVIKDGELRTSQAGNSFGMVTLSCDSGQTDGGGKPISAFIRCFAFGGLASVAANLRKGGRAYLEGTLSVGIWQPENGPAKLDLSVKCFRLEPTRIGKDRPSHGDSGAPAYRAPIERREREFDDAIEF